MRKSDLVRIGIVIICCFCFSSCKLGKDDKDVIVKVDPEIEIGMYEELGDVRDFSLVFNTIEPQSCSTNEINYTAGRNGRNISLNIIEIMEAANCQTGPGQVVGQHSYAYLPSGIYNLELNLKNTLTATGQLKVTEEKYELEIADGLGFEALQTTLNRVPQSTVWGYVAFKEPYVANAQQFLDDMKSLSQTVSLPKGDFSYFNVDEAGKLSLRNAPDYANFKTFYGEFSGDMSELESLLVNYRSQFPSGVMEFKIYTWLGKTL